MNAMEIPAATLAGKIVVMGCCFMIVAATLAWGVPKFIFFLKVVFGIAPRKPETKAIHLVLGFVIYALVFAPVFIASLIGVGIATAAPTRLNSEGVTGGDLFCASDLGYLSFSCTSSLNPRGDSRIMIPWTNIDRVDCISRRNGTIRELHIISGAQRITIGSLAVYDLNPVLHMILAHAPERTVQPCHVPLGRNQ